ncbi:MAG: radical SAM protein [Thermodesulfobacteriota bacterium]|jgi:histone acetyltransferase (RNA polymerase elongator complex component)
MTSSPLIIPVFLPSLGCRERCLFCNQKATAEGLPSPSSVRSFIEASLDGIPYDKKNREKQVAFYGGSFTAIHRDDQVRYLKEVQPFLAPGLIDSIRISTRPDALDEEILSLLKEYGVKTVEVGVQSMIDEVLALANRGHCAKDAVDVVHRLKNRNLEVGLQLMIGLPGDTCDLFLHTLDQVIELQPDFVRIHPTLVLEGAPLEILWRGGRYSPLQLDEAVQWLKKGILRLENSSLSVARIGLQPTKELERDFLAGPYHPAFRQLVDSAIFFDMATSLLHVSQKNGQALFFCHPKEVSNLRGQKNENILKLKDRFNLKEIFVQKREDVSRGSLVLQTSTGNVLINRKALC